MLANRRKLTPRQRFPRSSPEFDNRKWSNRSAARLGSAVIAEKISHVSPPAVQEGVHGKVLRDLVASGSDRNYGLVFDAGRAFFDEGFDLQFGGF